MVGQVESATSEQVCPDDSGALQSPLSTLLKSWDGKIIGGCQMEERWKEVS
jgi:hypothetical protein